MWGNECCVPTSLFSSSFRHQSVNVLSGRRFSWKASWSFFFFSLWLSKSFSVATDYNHNGQMICISSLVSPYRLCWKHIIIWGSTCIIRKGKPWPATFQKYFFFYQEEFRVSPNQLLCNLFQLASAWSGVSSNQVFSDVICLLCFFSAFITVTGKFCRGIWNIFGCVPIRCSVKLETLGTQDTTKLRDWSGVKSDELQKVNNSKQNVTCD